MSNFVKKNSLVSRIRKFVFSKAFLISLAALIVAVLLLIAIAWSTVPQVTVSRAIRGTAEELVIGSVEVSEYHALQLRSESHGIVVESFVEIGDEVKEGQVLMRLDTDTLQLELEKLLIEKENFEETLKIKHQSEYTLQKTLEDYEDLKRDVERGARSPRDLELAERNLQKHRDDMRKVELNQKLRLSVMENTIDKLRLQIEKMTIKSPVDGVVTDIKAREGDLVSAESVIFEVIDQRRLVTAEISEEDYNKVRQGMKATVWFLAYPKQRFDAVVSQILPTANPITQRYKAYLEVDIDKRMLTPGLTGDVTVVSERREHAVLVPSQAILGKHAFRVKNSRIESVQVEIGFKGLITVEVVEGLRENDIVLTENLTRFRDGDLVRLNWSEVSSEEE